MTEEHIKQKSEEYFKSICEDYNEELERTGKRHYWVGFDIKEAYIAGATENGIQWHKITDGDLPKAVGDYITNIGVLTYDHYGNNIYKWHTPFCEACDYGDVVDDDEVIAWCEIPQFKE